MNNTTSQALQLTDEIEWPNGEGCTPCTKEYAQLTDEIDALSDFGRIRMDDMEPDDYEAYNRLLSARADLQIQGHLGQGYRY